MSAMPQQVTQYSGDDRRSIDGYLSAKVETLEKSTDDVKVQISKLDVNIDKLGDSFDSKLEKMVISFDDKLEKMNTSFESKIDKMIISLDARLDEIAELVHSKFEEVSRDGVYVAEELDKKFLKLKWTAAIVFTIVGIILGALGIEVYPFLRVFLG